MRPRAANRVGYLRDHHQHNRKGAERFWRRWFLATSLLGGTLALLWLILRSGSKPSRFAYPCQQAALSTASAAFGVPLVAAILAARNRLLAALHTRTGAVVAAAGLFLTLGTWSYLSRADSAPVLRLDPPRDYRAKLYYVTQCPQDPVGERFVGVERLLGLMGHEGLKFYRSPNTSLLAGPDGLFAPDDTIVIKINYQWPERGGSNTDVLRGLIRCIVDHPDGFTGEVAVCENAQFQSTEGFDRLKNNAQDIALSPHDVVVAYAGQGWRISHYDWTAIRFTEVKEYSAGDTKDGYIIYPYDAVLQGRMSYPKFRTSLGTYISLKYGLWNPAGGSYDKQYLKLINLPVLKSHHSTYGATVCVKDYMGVVTRELGTNSHNAIARGILGAVMAETHPPTLNLLDCIWINANPYTGPATPYSGALRRDTLVASLDPIAIDIWSVKNILIPGFIESGFSPPWPPPSADPDDPSSKFRQYLDNSMSYLLAGGYQVTNDLDQIDAYAAVVGDVNCDGVVNAFDIDPFVLALTDPAGYAAAHPTCDRGLADINGDGAVDAFDIDPFVKLLTGP